MCFKYSLKKTQRKRKLNVPDLFSQLEMDFETSYLVNAFTFPLMPVITNTNPDKFSFFNWGLIPSWTKTFEDAKEIRKMTINARSETIFDKPSFRNIIKSKRCLIPATGFFEWHSYKDKKYPFFISLVNDDIFMFAGVWDSWTDKQTKEVINTYSIITTEANHILKKIHNIKQRMPVILEPEKEYLWLNTDLKQVELTSLIKPFDAKEMKAYTVSRLISSKNENQNSD